MYKNLLTKSIKNVGAVLVLLAFMIRLSSALDVYMVAKEYTETMPDGTTQVTMWGFAEDADGDLTTDGGEIASVPGPVITMPNTDSVLNIHVRNELPESISLVIPGCVTSMSPVTVTDEDGRTRIVSFTAETLPKDAKNDGIGHYTWTNVTEGTYLYHSGTNPSVQVQMGLYGAVKKDLSPGVAYTGVSYDNEAILLFSEIDPLLHEAVAPVAGGTPIFGTPAYPNTLNYLPRFFFINGESYPDALPILDHGIIKNENVLLRFLNAGLMSHIPTLNEANMDIIAEDGNLYPYPRDQYSVLLPALKTTDALFTPTVSGNITLYDRKVSPEGMLANLVVSEVPAPAIAIDKSPVAQIIDIGSDAIFNIEITNPSSVELSDVTVTDPLCNGGLPLPLLSGDDNPADGKLQSDEAWLYSCTVGSVTESFTNTATVVGFDPSNGTVTANSSADVTVINPVITIDKAPAVQIVDSGSNAEFTLTVTTGAGDALLENIAITDASCDVLTLDSGDVNTDNVLQTNETWSYTCTTNNVIADFTSSASVGGTALSGSIVNNTSGDAEVRVITPSIEITKTTTTPIVNLGDTVVFTLEVTNTGTATVTNPHDADLFIDPDPLVAITDTFCDSLTFDGGDNNPDDGLLQPAETWTYTCTDNNVIGSYTNSATAHGTAMSGTEVNANATADVAVIASAVSVLVASPTSQTVAPGTNVDFTLIVDNTGNNDLSNINITGSPIGFDSWAVDSGDNFGGTADGILQTTEIWSVTATISNVTTDLNTQATVSANDSLNNPVTSSPSGVASVTVSTPPVQRVTSGLVAFYPFNTGNGNTAFDQAPPDAGAPMNLTFGVGVSWSAGQNGLVFTGTGLAQSTGPGSKVINALQASNQSTFEAWVLPFNLGPQADGTARMISIGSAGNDTNYVLGQKEDSLEAILFHSGKAAGGQPFIQAKESIVTTLMHIVHTFDGNEEKLYIDGVLQPENILSAGLFSGWDITHPFNVGSEGDSTLGFEGEIRMIAVYDRALNVAEVLDNFNATPDVP